MRRSSAPMKILEVVGLTCRVGGVTMLDALSFTVEEGEILALCGPVRAGKTACLRCLSGALPIESGRLILDGFEVTGALPRDLVRHGLVRVGQLPTPPWSLSVAEAVTLALRWPRLGVLSALLATWRGARGSQVAALLDRVGLAADADRRRDALPAARSEERRVGKEGRGGRARGYGTKKIKARKTGS